MFEHLKYEFFVALIKLDSRKIEGFPLSNSSKHMRGRNFLSECWLVQTNFRRMNQGIEKGYFEPRYVILEIMENIYMLHVVCTGYRLWLFLLIARCSSKSVLIFKKLMGRSTFLVSVIFLFGGVAKKSWPEVIFTIQAINNDPGFVHYASPLQSDGDAQQVCSWKLMVAHSHRWQH